MKSAIFSSPRSSPRWFQEFNETTPANAEHGKQAISLIFNDLNRDVPLLGNFTPEFFASTNNPGQWVGALAVRVPIIETN